MKRIALFLSVLALFLTPKDTFAVSLVINEHPQEISGEFSVSFTITGAKAATNYVRILLSKDGSGQYIGQTWNGSEWYGGSDGKRYPSIAVHSGATEGLVKGKIEGLIDNGEYRLSLKRYTASGNEANDSIDPVKVNILVAKTIPPSVPTTSSPSPVTETWVPVIEMSGGPPESNIPIVLAETTDVQTSADPIPTPLIVSKVESSSREEAARPSTLPYVVGGIGMLLIGFGCFIFWRAYRNWYT